ncbi:hypothetical protein E2C01_037146 [Portunus trituberculatus]|uniref:Uncharacterized protein n=1 Tax=Portunus trituberculatus TaxID=210409 RepID=A0A5B7FDV3_PORTR|nr:hypothetical protein [Portunus trituberculatus]
MTEWPLEVQKEESEPLLLVHVRQTSELNGKITCCLKKQTTQSKTETKRRLVSAWPGWAENSVIVLCCTRWAGHRY